MLQDQKHSIGVLQLLEAKSNAAGTLTSKAIPIKDFRALTVSMNYGVFTPNTATAGVVVTLQESDDVVGANFTDVDSSKMLGSFDGVAVDASDDQRSEAAGYCGYKDYVRLKVVVPANATSAVLSADAIIGMADSPVTLPTLVSTT
jgi:hypothetical protein